MYDPRLAMSLKYNIAEFSAFKETSFRKQLEALLTSGGKTLSWADFRKKAEALHIEYNMRWLKTEYDQTVATANMADKWQDFVAQQDLYPNLKYSTVGDGRVREKHRNWHGLILPITHSFWKKHLPPNDWGCRCNVTQTDEEPTVTIPDTGGKSGFENNAAVSGKIFNKIPYADGLTNAEINDAKSFSKRNADGLIVERSVLKSFKNGGKITVSNLVDSAASDYADLIKCCTHFAKLGKETELLPRVNVKSPLYKQFFGKLIGTRFEGKCPDLNVGGLFYELEGFDGVDTGNKLTKMFSRGLKQSTRLIIKDNGSTLNHYLKVINFRIKEGQQIDEVWILRENGKLDQVY